MSETALRGQAYQESVNVGVVGATGLVGGIMLEVLDQRQFPVGDLRIFASEKSAGKSIEWQDRKLSIENAATANFKGLDVVFFSAGADTSRRLAPDAANDRAIVIDNSSAWRRNEAVPLVVSEVNPQALRYIPLGIVANPNCTTMVAMPPLKPLHDRAGLKALVVTTFQAVSGAGQRGVKELAEQSDLSAIPKVFPEPIAYNVIPERGDRIGRDTIEERKLQYESGRILGIGNLLVSATCASVPVYTGHSLSIEARFLNPISPEQAESLLSDAPGVELSDIPTPRHAAGGDVSLVGRIRQSNVFGKKGLSLFIAGDNLRKGAALNAVQIAELLFR